MKRAQPAPGGHEETVYEHEAQGMVGISRISAGGSFPMFGSSIERHHTLMSIKIHAAERHHDLSRDWFYARDLIAEVWLTQAQFAELITTPNVGFGVPCTIRYRDGREMEKLPRENQETEAAKIREDFAKDCADLASKFNEDIKEIRDLIEKLPKKTQTAILCHLDNILQEIRSNMPFVQRQFEEAAEKVVTASKAEIDAMMTHTIMAAGLQAISEKMQPAELPEKVEE